MCDEKKQTTQADNPPPYTRGEVSAALLSNIYSELQDSEQASWECDQSNGIAGKIYKVVIWRKREGERGEGRAKPLFPSSCHIDVLNCPRDHGINL